jgi:preprotein translocase subunit SecE
MNAKIENPASRLDSVKLIIAILLLLGGIVGYYHFDGYPTLARVLGVLAATGVAVIIAVQTLKGRSFMGFMVESQIEVRKVVWPTRAETLQATLAVVAMVLILGVVLWAFDYVLLMVVKKLTGQGG